MYIGIRHDRIRTVAVIVLYIKLDVRYCKIVYV